MRKIIRETIKEILLENEEAEKDKKALKSLGLPDNFPIGTVKDNQIVIKRKVGEGKSEEMAISDVQNQLESMGLNKIQKNIYKSMDEDLNVAAIYYYVNPAKK